MTPNHDVVLPQRAVLGSTMAYRDLSQRSMHHRIATPDFDGLAGA